MKLTFNQKVWLENFILNSNKLRWQMINTAKAKNDTENKQMVELVLNHNLKELKEILLKD